MAREVMVKDWKPLRLFPFIERCEKAFYSTTYPDVILCYGPLYRMRKWK